MRVFVTGGSGFVGTHLVRLLRERGEDVVCLVRSGSRVDHLKELQAELSIGDLRDEESIRRALKGCRVVYHCAADYRLWCPDPGEMFATNVQGTANVLRVAFEEGVERVVYTSTVGALGLNEDGRPANEQTPVKESDMIGPYKRSKFQAEREAENWVKRGLPLVIVNPSTPVGDCDWKPTPTGKIIVDFLKGKMFGYVETGMNLIDVADAAAGHLLAAERGKVGEKYILGCRNLTLKEIFDILSKLTGIRSPGLKVPHTVALTYAHIENFWSEKVRHREPFAPAESVKLSMHKMWFDSTRAVTELGLPQSPVEGALGRAVQWFRERGYV